MYLVCLIHFGDVAFTMTVTFTQSNKHTYGAVFVYMDSLYCINSGKFGSVLHNDKQMEVFIYVYIYLCILHMVGDP